MNILTRTAAAALLSVSTLALVPAAPAFAETVLRLDEVAVGELDPAKASDYADSILMFNVYDTLVLPAQGTPGLVRILRKAGRPMATPTHSSCAATSSSRAAIR
jgi:peptide/nickel transport system substrate-binding protein